jgi:hypothetical protein
MTQQLSLTAVQVAVHIATQLISSLTSANSYLASPKCYASVRGMQ